MRATIVPPLRDRYRTFRSVGLPCLSALFYARRTDNVDAYRHELNMWARHRADQLRSEQLRRVSLNARGVDRIDDIAAQHGITARELLERLMHFAISQHERPGSWEAQGFDLNAYDPDNGCADRWF